MNACAGVKRSHLQVVGESYTEHGQVALTVAWEAAKLAVAMTIHAVLPNRFQSYASDNVSKLYWFMQLRKKNGE